MNNLYLYDDQSMKQIEGERPSDEDLQAVADETLIIVRFRGNTFEMAVVEVEETEEEPAEEDEEPEVTIEYTLTWEKI